MKESSPDIHDSSNSNMTSMQYIVRRRWRACGVFAEVGKLKRAAHGGV